jgi:XisI protein
MDSSESHSLNEKYCQVVKQVIQRYAQFRPSHGNIRLDTVFDETQNRYALMQAGWDRGRRVRGNLIYVTIQNGKVWVEYDGMEAGISEALIAGGIRQEDIILGFLPDQDIAASA